MIANRSSHFLPGWFQHLQLFSFLDSGGSDILGFEKDVVEDRLNIFTIHEYMTHTGLD